MNTKSNLERKTMELGDFFRGVDSFDKDYKIRKAMREAVSEGDRKTAQEKFTEYENLLFKFGSENISKVNPDYFSYALEKIQNKLGEVHEYIRASRGIYLMQRPLSSMVKK